MDPAAYDEYQRIGVESSNEDRPLNRARFFMNWYLKTLKDKPNIHEEYKQKSDEYIEKEVENKELPAHFDSIDVSGKDSFLAGLRNYMTKNQNFLSGILSLELSSGFWKD